MRKFFVLVAVLVAASAVAQEAITPESLLSRGLASYRNRDDAAAITDLQAAAQGFLTPAQMQTYVNTGKFDRLQSFETALVYLALAQFRAGREDDARETLLRLQSAERITPTYATLSLGGDAAEVESLAAALLPSNPLPHNTKTPSDNPARALPAIQRKPEERVAVKKTMAEERAERQQLIDEIVARERERIQREADARIAAERQAIEKDAAARIAASQRDAEQKITSANTDAQKQIEQLRADAEKRVAAAESQSAEQVASAKRAAEQRVSAAEAEAKKSADARVAEIQRLTEQRITEERAAADRAATARVTESEAAARREYLMVLRTAEAAAGQGNVAEAVRLYAGLAGSTGVPREVLAEAAVGLYRTGAFREAADAFRKFGTFAKGEEDLRYYHAVALYETGQYADAQKELACALPFIQLTDDVIRYRTKIETTVAQTARK